MINSGSVLLRSKINLLVLYERSGADMSADNGIYILVTNRGKGKREYRVSEFQCVENLTYQPNYPAHNPQVSWDVMKSHFGKSKVLTDRKIAEGYAMGIADHMEQCGHICEYGIVWLEFPTMRFPEIRWDNGPIFLHGLPNREAQLQER